MRSQKVFKLINYKLYFSYFLLRQQLFNSWSYLQIFFFQIDHRLSNYIICPPRFRYSKELITGKKEFFPRSLKNLIPKRIKDFIQPLS